MAVNTTNFSKILKTDYKPPIVDMLENSSALLNRMDRDSEPTGGNFFYEPVRTLRTGAIGSRNEGDNLPVIGQPGYDAATFVTKTISASLRLTGKSMRVSRANPYAFAKAQVQDMEDTVTDVKKDVNRQLFSDGSGELCQFTGITAGTPNTVTVSSYHWSTNATKFLYAGMPIDVNVVTTGAFALNGQTITIADVPLTNAFTYTGTAFTTTTTSSGLSIYREGTMDTGGPKDIYGLLAITHTANPSAMPLAATARLTANYGYIDRTASGKTFWRGQVLVNPAGAGTTRPLTMNLLLQGEEAIKLNAGGQATLYQTNYPIYRIYGVSLTATKNADMEAMTLDGGFEALKVNGKPFVPDVECPDNVVFVLDEKNYKLGVTGEWEWIESNGNVLIRLQGTDNYEAVMLRDMQLICRKPKSNCQIRDVAHS